MNYLKLNNIVGWLVFFVAAFVYISTVEPSTSLWDCGEYITTSYKLEVGHPPGAPVFMMLGRIFSAFTSPENAAYMINIVSALSSAFCILFLFWTITHLAKKIVLSTNEGKLTDGGIIAVLGSGIIGALSYTFTDSFWFSAEEGEVYAMSSFFTAITFWAILKWEDNADNVSSDRWIVLIIFLIGLAIGVHMLNLLVIPAVGYVIYFKKYKTTIKGFLITGAVSIFVLAFIQSVFINKSISIAAAFERGFTNSLGTGFNIGTLAFFVIVLGVLSFLTYYFRNKGKRIYHLITLSLTVLIIGYASFAMIVVRSNANPPLDENDPETLPALQSYLGREQYGDWPIAYGGYWNSPGEQTDENRIVSSKYFKGFVINEQGIEKSFKTEFEAKNYLAKVGKQGLPIEHKYVVSGNNYYRAFPDGYDDQYTNLPRMWDPNPEKTAGYMYWSGYEGNKAVRALAPKKGDKSDAYIPTFGENLTFMFNYQIGWMYWRYFLWNFAGRQNDMQGHNYNYQGDGMLYSGALTRGNWLSGVNFIDKERLGDQSNLPTTLSEDESYNRYYYIPLILGLLGLIFHIIKMPKDAFNIFLLFFFTGLAIVIYLNQRPEEPRERDYAYAASFYAFSIWIGLAVLAIYHWGKNLTAEGIRKGLIGAGAAAVLFLLADFMNGGDMAFGYSIAYMCIIGVIMVAIGVIIHRITKNEKILASIAIVMGISSPFLLGSENWNDHDRSGRYFARDIAHNYLGTCEKNAILFCFGDNDTFPLWFAQEVEGYRTDMKVINYSLLSSDWHYNQMKKATYEAPPVKTILEEPDYRAGKRDYIVIDDQTKTKGGVALADVPVHAREMLEYMKSDRDIADPRMKKFGYARVPYRTLYIDVDKEAAIKSGILREDQVNRMVPRIEWKLSGDGFSKADLAIIDLLANYKWDRPIYFTSSYIQGANRGLGTYLQTEGLTSRLVPVTNPGLNRDKMYKLIVGEQIDVDGDGKDDSYKWGGLKNKGVFTDYYTMRMVRGARMHFMQIAEAYSNAANSLEAQYKVNRQIDSTIAPDPLIKENREKALKVLDVHFEEMPVGRVKVDELNAYLATIYFKAGDSIKGKKYSDQLAELFNENLTYFAKQDNDYIIKMVEEIGSFVNYFELLKQQSGLDKYDLKNYNPEVYNKLGEKMNTAMSTNQDFYGKIFRNLQEASQGRAQLILPFSFMQDKFPQFFGR